MTAPSQGLVAELLDWFDTWPRTPRGLGAAGRMTAALHPYDRLFSPVAVNRLELKNRIVMGPMGNLSMGDAAGRPGGKMIAYFAARAAGGAGLLVSGLVPVSPDSDPSVPQPGGHAWFPRLSGSRYLLAGWRDLAEAVHAHGARFFVQLSAGLGRVGSPECLATRWRLPVSSSWNPNFYVPALPCRPLTDRACRRIVRDFGQAAIDAKACGIDGIQVHGHEGYLVEQFANPAFNRRRLGRYADKQAFGLDIVREVRRRCGPGFPIIYRLDLSLALRETYGARMDTDPALRRFRGERTVAQTLEQIRGLVAAGVDMLDVDLGGYENWWLPHPPGPMPPGAHLRVARCVKEFLAAEGIVSTAGLPVPVAAAIKFDVANYLAHLEDRLDRCRGDHRLDGRFGTAAQLEELRDGGFDVVVCCTGARPVLPALATGAPIRTLLATDLLLAPALAAPAREVVVIGGGDVGCETAHLLAFELGKRVTVVELAPALMAASCTANRGYLIHALERQGVRLLTGTRVLRLVAGGVEAMRNVSPTLPPPGAVWRPLLPENVHNPLARRIDLEEQPLEIPADLVVVAVGMVPDRALYQACVAARVAPDIRNIGDSFCVGRVFDATKAAYATALAL